MPQEAMGLELRQNEQHAALRLPALFCDIYAALMLSVFLLYFDENGFGAITAAKRNCFYFLTGTFLEAQLLCCVALLCRSDTRAQLRQQLRVRLGGRNVVLLALLYFGEATLVSALLSPYPEAVWLGYSRYDSVLVQAMYLAALTALTLFAEPKRWYVYLTGAAMTVMTAVAALQVLGYNPLGLFQGTRSYAKTVADGHAFLGTIGNVDFVAQALCMAIPMFFVALVRNREKLRFLLLLPLWACMILTVQASVLAAYVGLFVGFVLAFPFVLRFGKKATVWYFVGLAAAGVLGLLALYLLDLGDGMLHEIHEILHGNLSDRFGSGRIYIWRLTLNKIPERLWFGFGPDTMRMMGWHFERFDEATQELITTSIDVAHNEYLQIAFAQGIFALAAYLVALLTALWHFCRYGKQDDFVALFGMAVLCYAVQAFFSISQPLVTPVFWVLWGLLEASVCRFRQNN